MQKTKWLIIVMFVLVGSFMAPGKIHAGETGGQYLVTGSAYASLVALHTKKQYEEVFGTGSPAANAYKDIYEKGLSDLAEVVAEAVGGGVETSIALKDAWTNHPERAEVVLWGLVFVGTPYRYASSDPSKGLDCSGLVRFVWAKAGVDVPHSSREIAGYPQVNPEHVLPGDIAWYPGHVMVHLGFDNIVVHAPSRGKTVEVRYAHRLNYTVSVV